MKFMYIRNIQLGLAYAMRYTEVMKTKGYTGYGKRCGLDTPTKKIYIPYDNNLVKKALDNKTELGCAESLLG